MAVIITDSIFRKTKGSDKMYSPVSFKTGGADLFLWRELRESNP